MLLQRLANTAATKNCCGIARTITFGADTKACKYFCYKTITELQESQYLMLQQRLANTTFTKTITGFQESQYLVLPQRLVNTAVAKIITGL